MPRRPSHGGRGSGDHFGVSSLSEITGGAALLIDPRSRGELRHAIEKLVTSTSLQRALSEKGRPRDSSPDEVQRILHNWMFRVQIRERNVEGAVAADRL